MKQYAMMRAGQEGACQELRKVINFVYEREAREAFGHDGTKVILDARSSGRLFGRGYFRKFGTWTRISGEEIELLETEAASLCEGEVIVQGDEGPVCGVAQVVDCHGVTVGHQEREEEEEQQEVEGEGEKQLKEHCACPWMG